MRVVVTKWRPVNVVAAKTSELVKLKVDPEFNDNQIEK